MVCVNIIMNGKNIANCVFNIQNKSLKEFVLLARSPRSLSEAQGGDELR